MLFSGIAISGEARDRYENWGERGDESPGEWGDESPGEWGDERRADGEVEVFFSREVLRLLRL